MKLLVSLLVVIGASLGDETGDTGARVCPVVLEKGEVLHQKLNDIVEECSQRNIQSSGVNLLVENENVTAEQIRAAFKAYCESRPAYSQCLDSAISNTSACFSKPEQSKFRLFRQYKELDYEIGCGDNGELMAQTFEATFLNGFNFPELCRENATSQVDTADIRDPNGGMIKEYKVLKKTLECLNEHRSPEHDLLVNTITTLVTELTERMKCVTDGADVLCKTIIESL